MFAFIPQKIFVLFIFILCYFLFIKKREYKVLIAFAGVGVLLLTRALNLNQAITSINFNVLGIFIGTMFLSTLFIHSGVPDYLASHLVNKSKSITMALLLVCGLSAFISSFTDNVATVLIVAPIALEIARRIGINPISLLIGVSLSSNLQGTATMIGDAPSIILAMESGMNFNDFFWMKGRAGIFFAVELGALAAFFILWVIFRKYNQPPSRIETKKPTTWIPTLLICLMISSLVISSFIRVKNQYTIAFICLFWALAGLLWHILSRRQNILFKNNIDWQTLLFLMGIFILVGSLTYSGIIEDFAEYISSVSGGNAFFAYMLIVWFSVIISAFVDNIPYTIAMIPVAKIIATNLGMPMYPFLFGLLIGTCLGGNITPFGAACNIATVGRLEKEGYKVKFIEFIKIGIPFTIAAVFIGSLFIWLIWRGVN